MKTPAATISLQSSLLKRCEKVTTLQTVSLLSPCQHSNIKIISAMLYGDSSAINNLLILMLLINAVIPTAPSMQASQYSTNVSHFPFFLLDHTYNHVRTLEYYKTRMFPVVCSMKYMYCKINPDRGMQDPSFKSHLLPSYLLNKSNYSQW